jgi:hypothetical protein
MAKIHNVLRAVGLIIDSDIDFWDEFIRKIYQDGTLPDKVKLALGTIIVKHYRDDQSRKEGLEQSIRNFYKAIRTAPNWRVWGREYAPSLLPDLDPVRPFVITILKDLIVSEARTASDALAALLVDEANFDVPPGGEDD